MINRLSHSVAVGLLGGSSLGDIASTERCRTNDRARPPLRDTDRSYVHHSPVLGSEGSGTCHTVPVSLPRISILEAAA